MDKEAKIYDLKERIKKFCDDRDWDQFHNAKDLAIGAITEASELLEHFRFQSQAETESIMKSEIKRTEIADELADVLFFVLRIAEKYNFDLSQSVEIKLQKNAKKYPIQKAKAVHTKYDQL